ncbi:restriction endonuclease subunit S [Vibrio cholerae]|nr:restriction endonuclease subunit S [Vibrio cholerae]EKF9607107.1 restriction endonuclease subunit S [Vibrio cholerae]
MGSEWKTAKLTDHYEIRSGLSKPAKDFGSGYPFLTFKDVFYNYFTPDTLGDLVESTEKDRVGCSVNRGDVFLTRTSETMNELGMSCVALKDYENSTFNGFCKRLRPRAGSDLVPEYVGYYLRSPLFRRSMMAFSTMSTRASLNNEMISRLDISYPSPAEQVEIARVLKTLDDKIFLNNQINQTLEQMAQAIFKSWFVDFDPVKAKMNGEQPEGMDAATASLFPEKLDSETGIPDDWKLSEIGDEVTVVGGGTPSKKNDDFWVDGHIHWTSPKDLSGVQDKVLLDTASKLTEAGLKKVSSGLLPIDTVLLSSRAPVGYLALAKVPTAINQGYIAMKCEKELPPEFVLQWCVHRMDEIEQRASGSTFAEISKKNFKPISVVVPSEEVLSAYQKLVKPLYDAITSNVCQSKQLSTLRDTLLPKLLSGEIELGQSVEVPE